MLCHLYALLSILLITDNNHLHVCRDSLQSLVAPTDALLAMCSSAAYGVKEGVGEHSKKLPAEVELNRLAQKWGVSTGNVPSPHIDCGTAVTTVAAFSLLHIIAITGGWMKHKPQEPWVVNMYSFDKTKQSI